MKIKANQIYTDMQLNKNIAIGDIYEVSDERGKQIINAGFAVEVKEEIPFEPDFNIDDVKEEPVKKTRKRK